MIKKKVIDISFFHRKDPNPIGPNQALFEISLIGLGQKIQFKNNNFYENLLKNNKIISDSFIID